MVTNKSTSLPSRCSPLATEPKRRMLVIPNRSCNSDWWARISSMYSCKVLISPQIINISACKYKENNRNFQICMKNLLTSVPILTRWFYRANICSACSLFFILIRRDLSVRHGGCILRLRGNGFDDLRFRSCQDILLLGDKFAISTKILHLRYIFPFFLCKLEKYCYLCN